MALRRPWLAPVMIIFGRLPRRLEKRSLTAGRRQNKSGRIRTVTERRDRLPRCQGTRAPGGVARGRREDRLEVLYDTVRHALIQGAHSGWCRGRARQAGAAALAPIVHLGLLEQRARPRLDWLQARAAATSPRPRPLFAAALSACAGEPRAARATRAHAAEACRARPRAGATRCRHLADRRTLERRAKAAVAMHSSWMASRPCEAVYLAAAPCTLPERLPSGRGIWYP